MAKTRGKKSSKGGAKTSNKKGISLFKAIFLLSILAVGAYFGWRIHKNPARIAPYTYLFSGSTSAEEQALATSAQVLMVGDRMAVDMNKYADALIENASRNITEPIKFNIWAKDGVGLHRTLAALKSLNKFPPVIIYYGASQEFFETRTHPSQYVTFQRNKAIHDHELVSSMLMAWPEISRVVYEPYTFYQFNLASEPKEGPVIGAGPGKLEHMEMLFKVFEWELEELVLLTKEKNSKLIIITPPVNLDVQPRSTCSYSDDASIRSALSEQMNLLNAGKSKEAYDSLKIIADQSVANALALYWFGQAGMKLGRNLDAKKALVKAAAVDCGTWRASPVLNGIIKGIAEKYGVALVDYDTQLNAMYGQNVLFFDEINPQNVYNRAMMSKLGELVARMMDL